MISTSIKATLFAVVFFILYKFLFSSSCSSCKMCTGDNCSFKTNGKLFPVFKEEEKEDTFNRDLELKIKQRNRVDEENDDESDEESDSDEIDDDEESDNLKK